jgi:hypothetical protein
VQELEIMHPREEQEKEEKDVSEEESNAVISKSASRCERISSERE